jgi:DNA gyrase subunit B
MNRPRGPVKLEDCQLTGPGSGAELFVTEGDSAALAVSRVRDPRFQAVLPMQGKPLNTLKASAGKVAANPFFSALTGALGTGWGGAFDARLRRYDRVLLLTDPDADGIHCGALLLMFFYRWMPSLIERGHLEMVRPPLGEIVSADGDSPHYVYSEPEFQSLMAEMRRSPDRARRTVRYRGLASMNPAALAEQCVDPGTRHSRRLAAADAEAAMEVFASLRELPPQQQLL